MLLLLLVLGALAKQKRTPVTLSQRSCRTGESRLQLISHALHALPWPPPFPDRFAPFVSPPALLLLFLYLLSSG